MNRNSMCPPGAGPARKGIPGVVAPSAASPSGREASKEKDEPSGNAKAPATRATDSNTSEGQSKYRQLGAGSGYMTTRSIRGNQSRCKRVTPGVLTECSL